MAVNESTGWARARLVGTGFPTGFANGCIELYSGAQPASADLPMVGTLLGRVTKNGNTWVAGTPTNGLNFIVADRFVIKTADTWVLKGLAAGVAQSWRLLANPPDDGAASDTAFRIDGAVGTLADLGSDYQMFLPSTDITTDTSLVIDNWWYGVPPFGA
jgi:hypothetical protein